MVAIPRRTYLAPMTTTSKEQRVVRLCRPGVICSAAAAVLIGCAPEAGPDTDARTDVASEQGLPADLWVDATEALLPETAEWTNKVELADLDGDGAIDLLFANGGDYSTPGEPELNRAFLNRIDAERGFVEVSAEVFGDRPDLTRVIKARDLNADGRADVFVGTTYQAPSRLYLQVAPADAVDGAETLRFEEVSATHLPRAPLSLGDAEPGDVDGDGDLDLVLADWGAGNNMTNAGGRTRLWLNDGTGRYTDATETHMPEVLIRFSWDVELVDVDNDFDLDLAVSCKRCPESLLFRNDGTGVFEVDYRGLPGYTNNYEFEAMDLDADGFLDLVTINDGEIVGGSPSSRREHLFLNDAGERFRDATDARWPPAENLGEDDNLVAFLDYDQDGDADFVIGSLSGPDRLMINDGAGNLTLAPEVFSGADTPGTLGMALADLDRDGRVDVVQSQGEHPTATDERVFLGTGLPRDTLPPVIGPVEVVEGGELLEVRARIHDRKSPTLAAEWREVATAWFEGEAEFRARMVWYGEYLWRGSAPPGAADLRVCATDLVGNESCEPVKR